VKEVLFNFLIVLFLFSLCLSQDNLDEVRFIGIDFLPYQENNTAIGLGFSNDKNSEILFSLQNWFTDNLYISGNLYPNKNVNNLFLQHSLNLGYMQKIDNQVFKSLVYNLGYHKKKYDENNFKNVSYGVLTYFRIESNFISIYYNFLDSETDNFEQLGFEYYRKLNQNYFIKIGSSFIKDDKDYNNTIYLKLNYCL
tara:strand:+ start:982 stop:1569 length:588 start_codon:yes stop_codon:yes gene_type:complete